MRRSEALGLRWSEVDLDIGELHINATLVKTADNRTVFAEKTKTTSSRRTVPIDEGTVGALRRHRLRELEKRVALGEDWSGGEVDFVSTDELGRPVEPDRATRVFQATAATVGLRAIGPHGSRHSLGTNAIRAGETPKMVADRLGHASITTTLDRYVHVNDADRRAAAEMGRRMIGGE